MEKSGAARVKQVYYCCAVFSVTHFKQRVFLLYLLAVYFALPVKYTVYCSTAISVVVVVPQPEAQPLKKELVVVVVPQPEAQPLKVHPKTCQVYEDDDDHLNTGISSQRVFYLLFFREPYLVKLNLKINL